MTIKLRTIGGVISLVSMILIWAGSALLIKIITGEGEDPPVGSLLMTFYCQAHCIVLLLPLLWSKLSLKESMKDFFNALCPSRVLILSLLFIAAQAFYNVSLQYLSLTTSTILSSTSPLFTFLFGLVILKQRFLILSGTGVLLAMGGAVLAAIYRPETPVASDNVELLGKSFVGMLLATGAAVCFGLVNTLTRKWLGDDDDNHTGTLFGFIGIISIILAPPTLFAAHITGIELWKLPLEQYWWIMTLNALIATVLSNYLWGVSVAILGPMIVAIATVATSPIMAVIDKIMYKLSFNAEYITGMVLVIGAVALVAYDQTRHDTRLNENTPDFTAEKELAI